MIERCDRCRFWEGLGEVDGYDIGLCRSSAPRATLVAGEAARGLAANALWARTWVFDWCGQFEPPAELLDPPASARVAAVEIEEDDAMRKPRFDFDPGKPVGRVFSPRAARAFEAQQIRTTGELWGFVLEARHRWRTALRDLPWVGRATVREVAQWVEGLNPVDGGPGEARLRAAGLKGRPRPPEPQD